MEPKLERLKSLFKKLKGRKKRRILCDLGDVV